MNIPERKKKRKVARAMEEAAFWARTLRYSGADIPAG